jgi:hypothetical protein
MNKQSNLTIDSTEGISIGDHLSIETLKPISRFKRFFYNLFRMKLPMKKTKFTVSEVCNDRNINITEL